MIAPAYAQDIIFAFYSSTSLPSLGSNGSVVCGCLLDAHRPERVLFADHVEAKGVEFYRAVCERDCEGVVAKRKDGVYSGRGRTWLKIKNPNYSQSEGRGELFDGRRRPGSPGARKGTLP
jgi:hypothetical protein